MYDKLTCGNITFCKVDLSNNPTYASNEVNSTVRMYKSLTWKIRLSSGMMCSVNCESGKIGFTCPGTASKSGRPMESSHQENI